MARSFVQSNGDELQASIVPVVGLPVTIFAMVRTSGVGNRGVGFIGKGGAGSEVGLSIGFSREINWRVRQFSTVTVDTPGTLAENVWSPIAGVSYSNSSHSVWENGNKTSSSASTEAISGQLFTRIGASRVDTMNGDIANFGIWNTGLTDEEILALSSGISPLLVRPSALATYVPLIDSADNDLITGAAFVPTGTPGITDSPRTYQPSSARRIFVPASAPPGPNPSPYYYNSLIGGF